MIDERDFLERALRRFEPEPGLTDRIFRRRDRKRRNQRITALVVGIAVFVAGVWLATGGGPFDRTRRPATPAPEPRDLFASGHGWIAYRDGSQIIAVDPGSPEHYVSLGSPRGAPFSPLYPFELFQGPIGWSRDGTRLLLKIAREGRRVDLYVMTSDGAVTRLTDTKPGQGRLGSFSPDGREVAVTLGDDGLYLVSAQGGTARLLLASDHERARWIESPAWSPDGSRIAFVVYDENAYKFSIQVVRPDGTGRHVLTDLGSKSISDLAWSPDGSQLAFSVSTHDEGGSGIHVVRRNGSGLRAITGRERIGDRWPAWSPDGTMIAFIRSFQDGFAELMMVEVDSGTEQLLEEGSPNGPIAWNPEG
jgi:Tol biopolymer transport system component